MVSIFALASTVSGLRERRYGSIARSITLPAEFNADNIEAKYEVGILTLRLPKSEAVKPKRIPILGAARKMIEGKMTDKKSGK